MEAEAAVNRLEAWVEKVDSDLNYAILRLENEFSATLEDELHGELEINPVKLIKRLEKVKEDFKILTNEAKDIEIEQKKMTMDLCVAISKPMKQINQTQLLAGVQPSCDLSEELRILTGDCDKIENESESQFTNVQDVHKDRNIAFLRDDSKDFMPITQEEFMAVSELVRGRSKLSDVNQVYEILFEYFKKNRKGALSLKDMTQMGLKVSGATGSAKLKVLRTLKVIQINKQGTVKMT